MRPLYREWTPRTWRTPRTLFGQPTAGLVRRPVRFDPAARQRVPLGGRTGVDRCRMSTEPRLPDLSTGQGSEDPRTGGASRLEALQKHRRQTPVRVRVSIHIPDTGEQTREQAYVPEDRKRTRLNSSH